MMANQYPTESDAQRIGHMAERTLDAVQPLSWRTRSLDGTDDVGFDLQVQVVEGSQYRGVFRLQLKGTESPEVSAADEFLSIGIKLTTLKYYEGVVEPILFVVCDLSKDADPRRCPAYYVWIHDEVARVRGKQLKDNQATITIRVPIINKLDSSFDVLPFLEEHRRLYESAKELDSSLRKRMPGIDTAGRSSLIEEFSQGIAVRSSAFVEAVTDTDTYWPEAPAHTVAGQLTAASTALNRGQRNETKDNLRRAEGELENATVLELAAYWYLKGKLAFADSDDAAACIAYAKACGFAPSNTKYRVNRIECDMVARKRASADADIADLVVEARGIDTPEGKGLAARLLVLCGRVQEARDLLQTVRVAETAVDAAIVEAVGGGDHQRLLAACTMGLSYRDLSIHARLQLLLIQGRTQLYAAIGIDPEQEKAYMPAGGPPNLDVENLEAAWESFNSAAPLLRSTGWPRVIEYASDAWMLAALYTGHEQEVLPDIQAAADAHPNIHDLHRGLERISAACDEFDTALKANEQQPETDEVIVRRVLLLHSANRISECIDLAVGKLPHCDRDTDQYPLALSVSITAADIVVRPNDATTLLEILSERAEWAPFTAVVSFVRARNSQILSADEALTKFKADYEAHGHSPIVGMQLLAHLDTSEEPDAEYCLEVAKHLERHQLLPVDLRFIVAQALTTLSRWNELLELSDATLKQHPNLARMKSVRAVALDKLGHTSEALIELSSLIGTGERLAIDVYVRIVTRLGDVEKASSLIEQLIAGEPSNQKRFRLVHLLFQLVHSADPASPRLPELAWRMGRLARRDVEMEEGVFLLSIFASNIAGGSDLAEARAEEVRSRIQEFSERFPKSTLFRMGTVSEESPLEDIKRLLNAFDPNSEERMQWQRATERKMERGEVPVPYSWRPRQILGYAENAVELWAYTKRAKRDKQQLRLNMIIQEWTPVTTVTRPPLLDITAILVLHELRRFGTLFKLFPTVAISQQTLRILQTLSASPFGSLATADAKSIQSELRTYREHILQPDGSLPTDSDRELRVFGFDMKRLLASEQYALYCDDGIFAIYAGGENGGIERFCTLDFLRMAVELNFLSLREMAEDVSKLCQWNVDVSISAPVLFAALPAGLNKSRSARAGADLIQADPVVSPILESIWSVRRGYQEIHSHLASALLALSTDERNPEVCVAALVLVWYWKASLRTELKLAPEARLALLFVHVFAAAQPSAPLSRRLRSIYLQVVEGRYGNNMDERRENEAIGELASACAEYDASVQPRPSPTTGERAVLAWTEGTAEKERFHRAYKDAAIRIAQRSNQGR
ncbi:DUF4365 domain-containing protein [Cupriavidus campinensis]|uniref:DUF4365 domain-containing protein n=2 Tax=Cupriavidus campinensis TaxID=151783 RepID=A0ABY3EKG9_9BURK|nr:DUF4365 domain-containing protein [Cupriavidus campinensis]